MQTILILLLVAAMAAVVYFLVRGLVTFLSDARAEVDGKGPSQAALKSNKMMQSRILFQAIAIVLVVLILLAAGRS